MFDNALHSEEVVRVNGNSTHSIIRWNLFVNNKIDEKNASSRIIENSGKIERERH